MIIECTTEVVFCHQKAIRMKFGWCLGVNNFSMRQNSSNRDFKVSGRVKLAMLII